MSFFKKLTKNIRDPKRNPPPPVMGLQCKKCGSKRVIQNGEMATSAPINETDSHEPISYKVDTGKTRYLHPIKKEAPLFTHLCVDCGFLDYQILKEDRERLWKVYQNRNLLK